jgi:hypothetical protein
MPFTSFTPSRTGSRDLLWLPCLNMVNVYFIFKNLFYLQKILENPFLLRKT